MGRNLEEKKAFSRHPLHVKSNLAKDNPKLQ